MADPRRRVPRTDAVLADPRLGIVLATTDRRQVKAAVAEAQDRARRGELDPDEVVTAAVEALSRFGPKAVLNATGVVLHTNLGRAPLAAAAVKAVVTAAGYTDVEFDLATGRRARRGRGATAALAAAVPAAAAVHVVNNGAAALVLAAASLASGREIVISRGELVEIGDGFRLPDLLESAGARLHEVGTTNRTTVGDYVAAVNPATGFILKVYPSNFLVSGFTSSVGVRELAALGVPVVVDTGSGLLAPDPLLPSEPDVTSALRDGASLVTASGDKLLGGPQAGLVLGRADLVERLRRHPLARALRVDKLTLAALEATLQGRTTPTWQALRIDLAQLWARTEALRVAAAAAGVEATVTESTAVVGGGGAPGQTLASWALCLPAAYAKALRTGTPPVVGRVDGGRLLLDLRCVPAEADDLVQRAILRAAGR
ncbi:MAG TPA: L-seryl-tRNA(Sec) selenium transferase [Micromonosporaceae bacterium]|nr:L-seryl-tRNA(Sec) selenium transferase [Micromonosporaceae bacterium]